MVTQLPASAECPHPPAVVAGVADGVSPNSPREAEWTDGDSPGLLVRGSPTGL